MMRMMRRIGRWKNVEERKTSQIFKYESRYIKKDVTRWKEDQAMKKGQKEDKKMKRWWSYDAQLNIDK